MSMTKLIYSDSFDKTADVGIKFVEDPKKLQKTAGTIFGCSYDDVKPDDKHVSLHVVALGDSEHYPFNRNGDGFPKVACVKYHDTFVKHGHVYRHHKNKDPKKSLGSVVKSAYNEPMGRVELLIHVNKEKAADELEKLAKDGEIPLSMACKVEFDRCSICGNLRKTASDPNQCEHVTTKLGQLMDDGRHVGTYNDEPKFFDISFVTRPADRIAWSLKSASGGVTSSVKLAEDADIWVPDSVAISSKDAIRKYSLLKKMASMEQLYLSKLAGSSSISPYVWNLRKAAVTDIAEEKIAELRRYNPDDVFSAFAASGIVMSPKTFFKYAFGPEVYAEFSDCMPGIMRKSATVYSTALEIGNCQGMCNEGLYDVKHILDIPSGLRKLASELSSSNTLVGELAERRVIDSTLYGRNIKLVDFHTKLAFNVDEIVNVLADKYAAYKLAAVQAILDKDTSVDTDSVAAIAVAQNIFE